MGDGEGDEGRRVESQKKKCGDASREGEGKKNIENRSNSLPDRSGSAHTQRGKERALT